AQRSFTSLTCSLRGLLRAAGLETRWAHRPQARVPASILWLSSETGIRSALTGSHAAGLVGVMRFTCAVALLLGVSSLAGADTEQGKFPLALNPDFQFRKAKIYTLSQDLPPSKGQKGNTLSDLTKKTAFKSRAVTQEASLNFE